MARAESSAESGRQWNIPGVAFLEIEGGPQIVEITLSPNEADAIGLKTDQDLANQAASFRVERSPGVLQTLLEAIFPSNCQAAASQLVRERMLLAASEHFQEGTREPESIKALEQLRREDYIARHLIEKNRFQLVVSQEKK